jgi:energy-coupling factor transport system permease protein
MTNRWRTVDIVVTSVIGVAFGVVFWAWGLLYNGPAEAIPLPGRAVLYGIWLVPAVLGGLVIRKPGAALWGWTIALQGPLEALGAELAFAIFAYRVWRLPVAALAAALAGLVAALYDKVFWYPTLSWVSFGVPYIAITVASSVVIAGLGSVALTRALAETGVLARFPSGRERAAV